MALDAMSRLQLTTAGGCGEPGIESSIRCVVLGGFTPGTPVSTPKEKNKREKERKIKEKKERKIKRERK